MAKGQAAQLSGDKILSECGNGLSCPVSHVSFGSNATDPAYLTHRVDVRFEPRKRPQPHGAATNRRLMHRSKSDSLFDQVVGARKQRLRHT